MLSLSLIFSLTFMEFVDYRRIRLEPSLVVDKSRGERLRVEMNITFARVPCYRESSHPPSLSSRDPDYLGTRRREQGVDRSFLGSC